MNQISKICTIVTLAILSCCAYFVYNNIISFIENQRIEEERLAADLAEAAKYDSIPLRSRIGRMFIVGLDSCALKHNDPVIKKIREYGVGGVILFGYNIPSSIPDSSSISRLKSLCSELQNLADYELLIGIDQEGGRVRRLRPSHGCPDIPSHAYLGRIDDEDSTRHYSALTASLLNSIGINLNFAPCVDVNMNPDCPVIGKVERAFSSDPSMVGKHAAYFIDEHRKHDVLTAVKHFPGHGSSVTDSHNGLTDISLTWSREELIPYKYLFGNDCCDMVMVGHIFNNQIDSLHPASLSKATVDGLLRRELGWQGLCISDDLGMSAINDHYPLEESLKLAVNAGLDMLMLVAHATPERLETAISTIETLVLTGQIPESRITQAYRRIDRAFATCPRLVQEVCQ